MSSTLPLVPALAGKFQSSQSSASANTNPQTDCSDDGETGHVDIRLHSTVQEAFSPGLLEETPAAEENLWVRLVEVFWKEASEGRRGATGVQRRACHTDDAVQL